MKKLIGCLLLALSFFFSATAQVDIIAKPKLSPLTQQYLLEAKRLANTNNPVVPNYVYKNCYGKLCLSAFIMVNNTIDTVKLYSLGVYVGTKARNIWTVQVPVESIYTFIYLPGIEYIQLDEPVHPMLDSVRKVTKVDSVHEGIALPMPYTGKNVVVGIIDAGFDYGHPVFYDTTGKQYRIKRVWEEKTTGTPPSGFSYGNEMTDAATIIAKGTDNNTLSHGTHVAGIAAGSGYGGDSTNEKYKGIAYAGDIVLVGIFPSADQWINTGMTDFVDGINYIFSYANSIGEPAVVNLSWGASLGPHDGTALFSQACDNLTGKGKIFVCAAGNNGGQAIHLQKTFTVTDTVVNTFVTFDPNLGFNKTWVDIWGDTAKTFCIAITLYNGGIPVMGTGYICLDDTTYNNYLIGTNGDTCFVTTTTSAAEFNQKPRTYLTLYSRVTEKICLSIKGSSGKVNAWNGYVYNHEGFYGPFINFFKPWAVNGDDMQTISDVSSTKSAVSVGAFASKIAFTNTNKNLISYFSYVKPGNIAPFSSLGPTADNRIKPDIAAPGLIVGSGVNSYDSSYLPSGINYSSEVSNYLDPKNGRTYTYGMLMGTSMASPATAGIVALMLQAKPTLTPDDVKSILAQTAIQDTYTGLIPAGGNTTWGNGKINAYDAIKKTITFTNVNNISNPLAGVHIYPNPNTGKFNIAYNGNYIGVIKIEVYNLAGQTVLSDQWIVGNANNLKTYDLSALRAGTYFTRLSSTIGTSVIKTIIE